jgi:SWI/SNF-related matrix-associated actin-dependent regulator of chromatin subfamily B protein 1
LKLIPALNDDEIKDIQSWMHVDKEYEVVFRRMKERMGEEAKSVIGTPSAAWWEKGFAGGNYNRWRRGRENFDVRYPKDRRRESRRKEKRREGLKLLVTLR